MTFITPPILSVLELFKGPLSGMRFGDVDSEQLTLLAAQVEGAAVEVASAEAKLAELRHVLAAEQEALLALAQRALAYARVYAESNDPLLTELNGISLPRPAKARKASPAKVADLAGAAVATQETPSASTATDAEPTRTSLPVEGRVDAREIELDPEQTGTEAAPSSSARKSRRSRLSPTETPSAGNERARATDAS